MFATLSGILFAGSLIAADLDPKVLKLVGPDARIIMGTDVQRYSESPLQAMFPASLARTTAGSVRQWITITYEEDKPPLSIFIGAPEASEETVLLDSATAIESDPAGVQEALQRWRSDEKPGELAQQVRRLSSSYDNWFLLVRPLQLIAREHDDTLKYRNELMQAIDQVSGGIRLGVFNEVHVEVVTKTPDDAITIAALAHWLPGFLQMENSHAGPGLLVNAAENLTTTARGNVVSISFTLSTEKLEQIMKSYRQPVED
jgi:hypothetical protein